LRGELEEKLRGELEVGDMKLTVMTEKVKALEATGEEAKHQLEEVERARSELERTCHDLQINLELTKHDRELKSLQHELELIHAELKQEKIERGKSDLKAFKLEEKLRASSQYSRSGFSKSKGSSKYLEQGLLVS
jgi:chromosome segregation ATPase